MTVFETDTLGVLLPMIKDHIWEFLMESPEPNAKDIENIICKEMQDMPEERLQEKTEDFQLQLYSMKDSEINIIRNKFGRLYDITLDGKNNGMISNRELLQDWMQHRISMPDKQWELGAYLKEYWNENMNEGFEFIYSDENLAYYICSGMLNYICNTNEVSEGCETKIMEYLKGHADVCGISCVSEVLDSMLSEHRRQYIDYLKIFVKLKKFFGDHEIINSCIPDNPYLSSSDVIYLFLGDKMIINYLLDNFECRMPCRSCFGKLQKAVIKLNDEELLIKARKTDIINRRNVKKAIKYALNESIIKIIPLLLCIKSEKHIIHKDQDM